MSNASSKSSSFASKKVVSSSGAAIKITALTLTQTAQKALSTGGAKIPSGGTPESTSSSATKGK